MKTENDIRRDFLADLGSFIEELPPHGASYIPHGVIRALLLVQATHGFTYDWHVEVHELPDGWMATGTLEIGWPVMHNGTMTHRRQAYSDVSAIERDPATASSRLFCRCVAFATGLGLQAWSPRGWAMAKKAVEGMVDD